MFQFLGSIGQLLGPEEQNGGESLKIWDLITIDEDDIDAEDTETEQLKKTLEQRDVLTTVEYK